MIINNHTVSYFFITPIHTPFSYLRTPLPAQNLKGNIVFLIAAMYIFVH